MPTDSAKVLTARDCLTRRERAVYKVLHAIGLACAVGGLYWYLFAAPEVTTYRDALLFAFPCLLVPVFGYALRSDTRIIYGVRFLREDATEDKTEK